MKVSIRHGLCETVADECRALGLQIGDTIEGTEGCGDWWNTTRLTLIWLGEDEAVWRETSRSSDRHEWSTPSEAVNWTLSCRDWRKVPNARDNQPASSRSG